MPVFKKEERSIVGFYDWHRTRWFTGVKDKFSTLSKSAAFDKSKNEKQTPFKIPKTISQILPTFFA